MLFVVLEGEVSLIVVLFFFASPSFKLKIMKDKEVQANESTEIESKKIENEIVDTLAFDFVDCIEDELFIKPVPTEKALF